MKNCLIRKGNDIMAKNGLKDRLATLSDSELSTLILSISAAAGVPESSVRALTDDISSLRKKLSSLGDAEIAALLSAIGTTDAERAIKNLKNR